MFNPIQEAFKSIRKEKGLFFSSLISLVAIFILFNMFIFGIFNLNNFKTKLENSNQAIIYVKTMTEDEIKNFQGKLLKIKGINTIKYESKESALQKLEKELNEDLSEEENPISDSFYLYIDKNVNISDLKNDILKNPEITELNMRANEIENTNKFSKKLDTYLLNGGIGVLVFTIVLISTITSFGIRIQKDEISKLIEDGISTLFIKISKIVESIILILFSTIIAFFTFINLQKLIVDGINLSHSNILNYASNEELIEIYLLSLLLGIIITIFFNIIGLQRYCSKKK